MSVSLEIAQRFMSLFAGLERAYGTFDIKTKSAAGEKQEGRGITVKKQLTVEHWQSHLEGKIGLGIIPITDEGTVSWGAIDIDVYDLNLNDLEEKIRTHPFLMCRSKSGGAHLLLFVKEPVPAYEMKNKLNEIAASLGFGGVEIYPKQVQIIADKGDTGQWLNMSYFGGDSSTRYCIHNKESRSMEEFLELADLKKITLEQLKDLKIIDNDVGEDAIPNGPPCLQLLIKLGFQQGTRNRGLYNLGIYLKKAWEDDWKQRLEDYNRRFMNPPLEAKEVLDTIKSLEKKSYNYTCSQDPLKPHCLKATCIKRKYGIRNGESSTDPDLPIIGGLTKMGDQSPLWFVDVEGTRIGPIETEDLQNQSRFQKVCMEQVNIMTPIVKPQKWRDCVQSLLSACQTIEMPLDSTPEGQLMQLVEDFCTGRAQCDKWEELVTLNKPYYNPTENMVYFKINDFKSFLDKHRFNEFKIQRIATILKDKGFNHKGFKIKTKGVNLWYITQFTKTDIEIDTPHFNNSDF